MYVDKSGVSMQTLEEILNSKTEFARKFLGENFNISPENVISNIITSISLMESDVESQVASLIKQFDPKTADSIYQDALFERVGLKRIEEAPSSFSINVRGIEGTTVLPNEMILEINSKSEPHRFSNVSEFTFGDSGVSPVEFVSYLNMPVKILSDTEFKITEAPEGVIGVDNHSLCNIKIGRVRESDSEFRKRFEDISNMKVKCTRNSVLTNLSELTGGIDFVSIYDSNTDVSIPAGSILIIANPKVSDEEFGAAVLANTILGINYLGDTTVSVPYGQGHFWDVKFQKAKAVSVQIKVVLKLKTGSYMNNVFSNVKREIVNFVGEKIFGLGANIYSEIFLVPTYAASGVEGVIGINIRKSSDTGWLNALNLNRDEYPVFDLENIYMEVQ